MPSSRAAAGFYQPPAEQKRMTEQVAGFCGSPQELNSGAEAIRVGLASRVLRGGRLGLIKEKIGAQHEKLDVIEPQAAPAARCRPSSDGKLELPGSHGLWLQFVPEPGDKRKDAPRNRSAESTWSRRRAITCTPA